MKTSSILPIVQITQEIIDSSRSMARYTLGTWCVVQDGHYKGYFDTREECETWVERHPAEVARLFAKSLTKEVY